MGKNMTGYGNHSCAECFNKQCPISNFSKAPNGCSYYDPPNGSWEKRYPTWYFRELRQIAKERMESGLPVGISTAG